MAGLGMGFLTMGVPTSPKLAPVVLRPGDILVVIHDFNARSSDELTLRKSERIELIELDEGFGDGWYLGRHLSRGGTGLFPGVYTAKAPSSVRPPMPPPMNRSSYSPPPSSYSNTQLSPIPPSPASYQPSILQTGVPNRAPSQYSPAFGYDSPRASLPAPYTSHTPAVQRSISQALRDDNGDEDSPVMNETLSVIDEHITDLSTPRQSVIPPRTIREDSESDYSSHVDRQSYIAGPETDDEENGVLNETDVRKWDHKRTAQHLRLIGVDPKHCDIFEEQEISGEVVLDMDQGFIYMKEYDFGVMGRRLKTWHKIRDFQNEVKRGKISSRQSTLASVPSIDGSSSLEDVGRTSNRMISNSTLLPRIPSLSDKPGLNIRQSQPPTMSSDDTNSIISQPQSTLGRSSLPAQTPPSTWRSSMISDGSSRPSAAMIRELSHSRRHSSIDFGKGVDLQLAGMAPSSPAKSHHKQPSLDREWSMSGSTMGAVTASPTSTEPVKTPSKSQPAISPPIVTNLDPEYDRGYFSGNELDNRKQRTILRKRGSGSASAQHSRQSSANNMAMKRHSRLASVDSIREIGSSMASATKAYQAFTYKGRLRSASAKGSVSRSLGSAGSPTVTNLEEQAPVPVSKNASVESTPKPTMQDKARKLIGFKSPQDATTSTEKLQSQAEPSQDSSRPSPVTSPTGSTTPSGTSHSLENETPEPTSKLNDVPGLILPKAQARTRPKAKQETSAYQRGLLKLTPEEARKTCDYHGWMKKKSSSLITTWKPRLFILRGRRLSYYYAEDDTQERGIIDISGHKVLVANSDAMVTLHAQITGATSAASPNANPSSTEPSPVIPKSPEAGSGTPFYFKLVPPKSGFSRAVQFTKPTIHFFQVDSLEEGRKWMGEIMKATIEHDLSSFETTNKQKTISLAKARARKERPPALQEMAEGEDLDLPDEENKENVHEAGLNIQGLNFDSSREPVELAASGGGDAIKASVASGTDTTGGVSEAPTTEAGAAAAAALSAAR